MEIRMFRGHCGHPQDGSLTLLLADYFPDGDIFSRATGDAGHWAHLPLSGTSLAALEAFLWLFLTISQLLKSTILTSKGVWRGVYISDQVMKNTYTKSLVKHTAMLIHYFWCKQVSNFLVAQPKDHLWFHSPAVLSSRCGEEQGTRGVCCELEGMEHHQRGARHFNLGAVTRQC